MTAPATLEQTLRISRMLSQGDSPGDIQRRIAQEAEEATVRVMTELQRRQESMENQLRAIHTTAQELQPFRGTQLGVQAMEQALLSLKEGRKILERTLKVHESKLEQQQKAKTQTKAAVATCEQVLASLPMQSATETALHHLGEAAGKTGRKNIASQPLPSYNEASLVQLNKAAGK